MSRDRLRVETVHRGAVCWAGEAPYTDLQGLTDAIARLAAEPAVPCWRLEVVLERPPVQVRTLTDLPPVSNRQLGLLVAHQAGRFFRQNGHPLVTDAAWVATGGDRVVRAAAVEEELVEAIAAGARAAGLVLEDVTPAGDGPGLALLPRSEQAARERRERTQLRRLVIAAAGIWVGVGTLFVGRIAWERRVVEGELARLARPLAVLLAARRELREAEASVQAVANAERARGRSLAALGAIAGALPDSGVVTSLTWRADGTGVLTGAARRAAEVVARLERVPALPGPRLEGPVVRERVGAREWERFTVVVGRHRGSGREDGS